MQKQDLPLQKVSIWGPMREVGYRGFASLRGTLPRRGYFQEST